MNQNPFSRSPLGALADEWNSEGVKLPDFSEIQVEPPGSQKGPGGSDLLPPPDLRPVFESTARKYGVPVNVLMALAQQESSYRTTAVGVPTKWGRAKGIMQYIDPTAKAVGINPFDPAQSIDAAARQYAERIQNGYSHQEAVMAHHGGDDRRQWGPKTQAYGQQVLDKAFRIGGAFAPVPAPEQSQSPAASGLPGLSNEPTGNLDPRMGREQYVAQFRKTNPNASLDDVEQAMRWYDQQREQMKPQQFAPTAVQDRFAQITQDPSERFNQQLDERFKGEQRGVVPQLPGKIEAPKQPDPEIIEPGFFERLPQVAQKGWANMTRSLDVSRAVLSDDFTPETVDLIASTIEQQMAQHKGDLRNQTASERELNAAIEKFGKTEGFADTTTGVFSLLGAVFSNPRGVALGTVEQLANMLPSISGAAGGAAVGAGVGAGVGSVVPGAGTAVGATVGGVWGSRAGLAAGTSVLEYGNEITEAITSRLEKQGKPATRENIAALLSDPAIQQEVKAQAAKKGLTLAAVDALTMGLAGKVGAKAVRSTTRGGRVGYGAGAVGVELAGEPTGEAVSQLVARGEIDKADVAAEAIYGAGTSLVGAGIATGTQVLSDRVRRGGSAEPSGVAPAPAASSPGEQAAEPPEVQPAPSGPLGRAMQAAPAAPAPTESQERVVLRTPEGEMPAVIEGVLEDGRVRVLTDDGMSIDIGPRDGVEILRAGDMAAMPPMEGRAEPTISDAPVEMREDRTEPVADVLPELTPETRQEPTESAPDMQLRTDGTPFASEASARQALKNRRLKDHEVVPFNGGWAISPATAQQPQGGRDGLQEARQEAAEEVTPAITEDAIQSQLSEASARLRSAQESGTDADLAAAQREYGATTDRIRQQVVEQNERQGFESIDPDSLRRVASWVIRDKNTGEVVMETFERAEVEALNTSRYEAVAIGRHLASLNQQDAPQGPQGSRADQSPEQEVESMSPDGVALKAAQIRRREAKESLDPRKDPVAMQEDYLRGLARDTPSVAAEIAKSWRDNPKMASEAAGVSDEMVGRYASIIESQLRISEATDQQAASGQPEATAATPQPVPAEQIKEAARYLKDFAYSLDQLDGMTDAAQVELSSSFGKSGRDSLLMSAFGITRDQAHEINNGLDASKPRKLRQIDMQEAFDTFPGLREMIDGAISEASAREARKAAKQSAPADQPKQSDYGKTNKVFTEDAAAKAREVLRKKLGQINSGLDPEMVQAGITLAGYHIEAGARKFADYSKAMIDDLGEAVRPYLRSWYEGVRYYPGIDNAGMTPSAEIDAGPQEASREGNTTQVRVGDERIPAQWVVVEADELQATLSKSDNQYRDRTRAASQQQIAKIANDPDFDMLADAPVMDFGAPTLAMDGQTIIGGNGRFAALVRAYEQGTANEYRASLEAAAARFGVSADGMRQPVLVRRFTEPVDVKKAAIASNEGGGLDMSPLEQAKVDAERMGDMANFIADDNGNISMSANREFIREFMSKIPQNKQADLVDADGGLSPRGLQRIKNAVLYRAYGDSPVLRRLIDSADQGLRNVANALLRAAPRIADARARMEEGALFDLDISSDIILAVESLNKMREDGQGIDDFLNQMGLFGDALTPEAASIMRFLDENTRSAKAMADFLLSYYNSVMALGDPNQGNMFGDMPTPSRQEIINEAARRNTARTGQQADIFASGETGAQDRPRPADQGDAGRQEGGQVNAASTREGLERDRRDAEAAQPGDGPAVSDERPSDGRADRRASEGAEGSQEGRPAGDRGVSETRPAVRGERSDQQVHREDGEFRPADGAARTDDGAGDAGTRADGVPAGREAVEPTASTVEQSRSVADKLAAQKAAEPIAVKVADRKNIDETLPFLLEGQREDVHFAETRFAKPDGYGVLFTNGTGTGKTYLGLGLAKRMAKQGKTNGIVVVPNQEVMNEWIASAPSLGLKVNPLESTKDAGKGLSITTYANFGANNDLAKRDFDFVIADEAHTLMQGKDAEPTAALQNLRAITLHPTAARQRAEMLNPDIVPRLKEINEQLESNRKAMNRDDTMDQMVSALREENTKLEAERTKLSDKLREVTAEQQAKIDANQLERRPRAVFLSATPFSYEQSVAWGEGYLYDFPEVRDRGYNTPSPFGAFMIQNFGWRMRTGKLSQPDAQVDRAVMQRNFNAWLRRQGVLSTRMLESDFDYERRFVLVKEGIGQRIDEVLKWLRDAKDGRYFPLYDEVRRSFDYTSRRMMLESIKAQEAIEHIKKHHKLGRKVVVFYDYNKGREAKLFDFRKRADNMTMLTSKYVGGRIVSEEVKWNDLVDEFNTAHPGMNGLRFGGENRGALQILTEAFPNAGVLNGLQEYKKQGRTALRNFNDDSNRDANLLIVQSDKNAGWSGHDKTGKNQRVLLNLGMPAAPSRTIQQEGRIFRVGQQSNAVFEYFNTGTTWERSTFAEAIASKADTVENMAMGDMARALKNAFIQGFIESDVYEPGPNDGKGGKQRDRALVSAVTEFEKAMSLYFGQQKKTSRTKAAEGADYFATPEPVGLKMVEFADIRAGDKLLEPSAGHGAIARWFPELNDRTVIEPSMELSSRLGLATSAKRLMERFEDHNIVNKYDAIVMNPPFGVGGKTAYDHIEKALGHLRDGGRVVALVPDGPTANKRLEKLLYEQDEKGRSVRPDIFLRATVTLPTATFERAGTSVASKIIVIDKISDDKAAARMTETNIDLRDAENINDLFSRIEPIEIGPREGASKSRAPTVATSVEQRESSPDTLVRAGLTVTEGQTNNGNPVWEVTGPGTREHKDMLKELGGRWYRPKSAWSFYKGDPTASIAEKLEQGPRYSVASHSEALSEMLAAEEAMEVLRGDDASEVTLEQWSALTDRSFEAKNALTAELARIPDDGFVLQASASGGRSLILTRSAQQPGKWQLTRFDAKGAPWGDTNYGTKEQAIREFIDEADLKTMRTGDGAMFSVATDTPAFKAWFGDSKVVDENGEPLVVYHGTMTDITEFRRGEGGTYGAGIYFGKDPETANFWAGDRAAEGFDSEFGGNVVPAYVSIKKPADEETAGDYEARFGENAWRELEKAGFDGIIAGDEVVAFRPEQIKSAIGNRGTYDPTNPDIRYSVMRLSPRAGDIVRTLINETPIGNAIIDLMKRGRLVMHESVTDFSENAPVGAQAATMPNGVIHLFADGLDAASAPSVLLHEAYHSGAEALIGSKAWNKLQTRLGALYRQAQRSEGNLNKFWQAAGRRVEDARRRGDTMSESRAIEEFGAYAIENYDAAPATVRKWVDDLIGAVKAWLLRNFGIQAGAVTPAQLRQLAVAALRDMAERPRNPVTTGDGVQYSVQTQTPEFRRWFGDSKVVDENGEPLVVYHGSPDARFVSDDGVFRSTRNRLGMTEDPEGAFWFAESKRIAETYADDRRAFDYQNAEPGVVPAYLRLENPLIVDGKGGHWRDVQARGKTSDVIEQAKNEGRDGVIILNVRDAYSSIDKPKKGEATTTYVVFRPEQIKSATDNAGTFDPNNPDIRYSVKPSEHFDDLDKDQKSFMDKIGPDKLPQRLGDRWKQLTDNLALRIRIAGVDRYGALLRNDQALYGEDTLEGSIASSSWVLARMSHSAGGAVSAMLNQGRIYYDAKEKVIDVRENTRGLSSVLQELGSPQEIDRFMAWMAANRSRKLMGEGRENLFTPEEVEAGIRLSDGRLKDGRNRGTLYVKTWREFQKYRDDVLAIAEAAGTITPEQRETWAEEFYVPFYRVMDDETVGGPGGSSGLSRQQAYKQLKGGKQNLNDLLENTLLNFHHLVQSSLKNVAARQAIENAVALEIAEPTTEKARNKKLSTFVMEGGQKQWYDINDPLTFKALAALTFPGYNNPAMKIGRAFKRLFTNLTTITPQFIIANTLRDTLSAMATSPTSMVPFKNAIDGAMTYANGDSRYRMLASGGAFSFGHIYGQNADEVKVSTKGAMREAKILTQPKLIPSMLRNAWNRWGRVTDFAENINRAGIWQQNLSRGKLKAAFEARDLIDFSAHGDAIIVRVLTDLVPFLNARIQGLDKLYRSGVKPGAKTLAGRGNKADAMAFARFAAVTGALSLVTMLLYLRNWDDEDYRELEDWQRDSYWIFKTGDQMYFIPKPFEVGAIATVTERLLEQFMDPTVGGEKFWKRMGHILTDTFSFDLTPQAIKPLMELGANENSFTGRPIETPAMEGLNPSLRSTPTTSRLAEGASRGLEAAMGDSALSPVQIDHLIQGYFGAVGSHALGATDVLWRTLMGEELPARRWYEYQPVRRFYRNLGDEPAYTRYGTDFYDALKEVNRAAKIIDHLLKYQEFERADAMIEKNEDKLGMRQALNRVSRDLSKINAEMKLIQADKEMSGEQKREELDRLRELRNLYTKDIVQAIEEDRVKRRAE